jgi:hypothetical protein
VEHPQPKFYNGSPPRMHRAGPRVLWTPASCALCEVPVLEGSSLRCELSSHKGPQLKAPRRLPSATAVAN